ncbi:MAG: hypothetical protein ACPG41_07640 [Lacinutrix venerupis]
MKDQKKKKKIDKIQRKEDKRRKPNDFIKIKEVVDFEYLNLKIEIEKTCEVYLNKN